MPMIQDFPTLCRAVDLLVADSGIPPSFPEADAMRTTLYHLSEQSGQNFQAAGAELSRLTPEELETAVIGEEGVVSLSEETSDLLTWLFNYPTS